MNDKIAALLSAFKSQITTLNSNNELSINIEAENIIGSLFNEVYGMQLENANHYYFNNAPAVDLIDSNLKIAIQVTANNTSDKVRRTIEKFFQHDLNKSYCTLIIFFLKDSKSIPLEKIKETLITKGICTEELLGEVIIEIKDLEDLYRDIANTVDVVKKKKILETLETYLPELWRSIVVIDVFRATIFMSYCDEDYEKLKPIILALTSNKIRIVHNNKRLQNDSRFPDNLRTALVYQTDTNESDIIPHICCVFLSRYYLARSDRGYKDAVLDYSIKKKAKILSFQIEQVELKPWINKTKLDEIVFVSVAEVDLVLEEIFNKIKVTQQLEYKGFEEVLKTVMEETFLELVDQDVSLGYKLFKSTNDITGSEFYFLCFQKRGNKDQVFEIFRQKYNQILKDRSFSILLIKDLSQKDLDKRKTNFKEKFNPKNIWYTDEFIWEYSLKKKLKLQLSTPEKQLFIHPLLLKGDDIKEYEVLIEWLDTPNIPILILKGAGGIGKTTVASNIRYEFFQKRPNTGHCIFIELSSFVRELSNTSISSLYELYKLYSDQEILSEKEFELNFDNGNILFILDGLDELIFRNDIFDLQGFIIDIIDSTSSLGYGKIVITCRDYFWNKVKVDPSGKIKTYEILPFNEERAVDYFIKKYPDDIRRAKRCIELAKKFTKPSEINEYEFIPFILEVVDNQLDIKSANTIYDESQDDALFFSDILKPSNFSDYIFYKICYRETIRQGYSNVDEQIKLFMQMTLDNYESENAKTTLQKFELTYNTVYDGSSHFSFESILSHPVLHNTDECISFKYDFFKDYFKSLIISNLLDKKIIEIPASYINILINHVRFDSNFTQEIAIRFEKLTAEIMSNILDAIAIIRKMDEVVATKEKKSKAISSLFIIALKIHYKNQKPDIETNTNIMLELFGSKDEIQGLCINDINSAGENQLLFNFSDLIITESYIVNYSNFLRCRVNSNTKFVYSTISNIPLIKHKETKFRISHFDHSNVIDFQLTEFLKEVEYIGKDIGLLIMKDLKNLLTVLKPNNRFEKVKLKRNIEPKFHYKIIELNELIQQLELEGIITKTKESVENSVLFVNPKWEADISNFLNNGILSPELSVFSNRLINMYKGRVPE